MTRHRIYLTRILLGFKSAMKPLTVGALVGQQLMGNVDAGGGSNGAHYLHYALDNVLVGG